MISITVNIPTPTSIVRWLPVAMAPATTIIMGIDLRIRGDESILVHGIADEFAHVLTALVIFAGIRALGLPVSWIGAAIGAVIVDLGHLADLMGLIEAVEGSSRSVEHSLAPALGIMFLGLIIPPARVFFLCLGFGIVTHILRDSATGTTPLYWPVTEHAYHLRYSAYLVILLAFATVASGVVALGYQRSPRD